MENQGNECGGVTRRELIVGTIATALLASSLPAQTTSAIQKRLLLGGYSGLPGQPFPGPGQVGNTEKDDPELLAQECKRLGYTAAYCPPANPEDTARLKAIREAFAKQNIVIAEVGAWRNIMTPDLAARKANLDYVISQMAVAEEVGARCCVDITGSFDAATLSGPHPKNQSQEFIDGTVENCRKIVDAVKPKRSTFAIEMKGCNFPDGPDPYLKLIQAVDRPQGFGVHIDICNIVNSPMRYYNNTALIKETFAKLGKWVKSCHAKDLLWVPQVNVNFQETVPGQGGIKTANVPGVDYHTYVTEVVKVGAPLMLEHLTSAEEYKQGAEYIRKVAMELGIAV
jgi:sugar phosphate isomerase/epimerase